jgi:hypothetical protein
MMIVILENTDYDQAIKQPFLASLARRGALLENFHAETHPSQPNYIALIAGSTYGVSSDRNVTLDERHIGDLLDAKGLTWKVYAEGYPGHCFLGARAGAYVRKHVPFLSFKDVQTIPDRCAKIVPASDLKADLRDRALADYSLFIPDLDDDGHDTSVAYSDRWLARVFGPLLRDRRFTRNMLLVVTFDEGKNSRSNHIATLLVGDAVLPGGRSEQPCNHYSVLRLAEDMFGLGTLGQNDARAIQISGIWK